jgi:hypothetical protein
MKRTFFLLTGLLRSPVPTIENQTAAQCIHEAGLVSGLSGLGLDVKSTKHWHVDREVTDNPYDEL